MARWYGNTTQRALGAEHVADLKRLKAALRDGEPCWRCGHPMYRTQALERDHIIDRVHGGATGPAVLAHARCNRSAGATMGNQLRGFTPAVAVVGRNVTCKTCGKPYHYAARACEMCGLHYHPSYGQQRTCSRACGVELRRRTNGTAGSKPLPRPACKTCGRPCNGLQRLYCSKACAGEDNRQQWPSSRIQHYTCRYCGKQGVAKATGTMREVCPERECQLARLMANNLRARHGLTKDEADAQMATIVINGRASRVW